MPAANLWHLFVAFTRANLLGYGGGPAVIPLIQAEVVDTFGWLTKDEFASALAVGNALPGPIATKMSTYLGYKVAGASGAAVALAATALPTAFLMVLLAALLMRSESHPVIKGIIKAVKAVVFALFVQLAVEYFAFAWPSGWAWPTRAGWLTAAVAVAALVALLHFRVQAGLVVLAAIVFGGALLR